MCLHLGVSRKLTPGPGETQRHRRLRSQCTGLAPSCASRCARSLWSRALSSSVSCGLPAAGSRRLGRWSVVSVGMAAAPLHPAWTVACQLPAVPAQLSVATTPLNGPGAEFVAQQIQCGRFDGGQRWCAVRGSGWVLRRDGIRARCRRVPDPGPLTRHGVGAAYSACGTTSPAPDLPGVCRARSSWGDVHSCSGRPARHR